jgi:pimeloyl-ACP methyl ester carboxylesterase
VRITDFDVALSDGIIRGRRLSQRGDGMLVFLHDSFGCIEAWRDFPPKLALATHADAIIYDRRGYGQSPPFVSAKRGLDYLHRQAEVLAEFLAKLAIRDVVVFGHSDGGTIALLAAALHGERIKAVIAEGAHVFVEEIGREGIRAAIDAYANGDLKAKLERYHGDKTDAMFRAWHETWLSAEFQHWNIERELGAVKCPVLVVQGEQDEYGTLAQVDAIARAVSGRCETFVVPNAGHTAHKDATEAVVKRCAEFLKR